MSGGPVEASVEDDAVTRYVLAHHASFQTAAEKRVLRALDLEQQALVCGSEWIAARLRKEAGLPGDVEAADALRDGPERYRRSVRDRILREHPGDVVPNRCPLCRRVVRTPLARQCLWCGHDWHGSPS